MSEHLNGEAGRGFGAAPLLGAVEIRLPYKRKQRWFGLQYRWRNARWTEERRHHFAVFNAVMQVPQFMRDKFFRRECKRLGISEASEIITIENNMTGDTIWIVKAPNDELSDGPSKT